jgi:nitrate/TMAO reductase-like tetraheme cytochrome c subunit
MSFGTPDLVLALQQPVAAQDTAAIDSVVVESPLPSAATAVAKFLFNSVPQWVQIAGVVVALVVFVFLVVLVWRRRREIGGWLGARSRGWKLGMSAIVLLAIGGVGFAGLRTWNYMMHDNQFCTSCHVMDVPFRRFTASEHSKLGCHDCHRQGMMDNVKELYVWVLERPEEIPAHAPVPNSICAECHIQNDPDSTWKRIVATAGHAVHLNPASPAMRTMECVTCHGQEVHRFKPAETTCAQSGCHDNVQIQLGRMSGQTTLHCSTCHVFTAAAAETDSTRSARGALVPNQDQCLECHEMREQMRNFAPEGEPHDAVCGTCHNPHTQTTTAGAFQSCATSGCHARSDTLTAMHRGLTGRHKLETCGACHSAHTWKTAGTRCESCHSGIRDPAVQVRPPRSSDAAAADAGSSPSVHATPVRLMPASWTPEREAGAVFAPHNAGRVQRRRTTITSPTVRPIAARPHEAPHAPLRQRQARDTTSRFEHAQHRPVNCTTCHSTQVEHGGLNRTARRCTACHHADNRIGRDCARCHQAAELTQSYPAAMTLQLSVKPSPTTRTLSFAHETHAKVSCADCHGQDLSRSVEKTCASCHTDHHEATRDCASCHPAARSTHTRAVHLTGCGGSGCHYREATAATSTARNVCLACHAELKEHKPGGDCSTCHLTNWRAVATTRGP